MCGFLNLFGQVNHDRGDDLLLHRPLLNQSEICNGSVDSDASILTHCLLARKAPRDVCGLVAVIHFRVEHLHGSPVQD